MDKNEEIFKKAVQYINTALKGDIEVKDVIRKVDIGNDEFELLKDNRWILEWSGSENGGIWYLGLSKGWDSVLSRIVFGTENENGAEVAGDLVKEFVSNLINNISRSDNKLQQNKKDKSLKIVKAGELNEDHDWDTYSFLQIQIEGNIDSAKEANIKLTIILAIPPDPKSTNGLQEKVAKKGKRGNNMNENDPINGKKVEFEEFSDTEETGDIKGRNIEILKDVEMNISVELGRNELPLGDILQLVKGSVVALDKMAGEPVEVLVNGFRIAQGEVVVIDEHFGVRITGLVSERERMKSLG